MLSTLISRLEDAALLETNVIPWSSPVLSFGDFENARVGTLGLNPSNREFVDEGGNELDGSARRFHTLRSLGLSSWSETEEHHLDLIMDSCREYFSRNPYDGWFKRLDNVISGTDFSYYGRQAKACHLDLIPYATACKWTELSNSQRSDLLKIAGDTLSLVLRGSQIEVLVLNGNSVVGQFQEIGDICLEKQPMPDWSLPRRSGPPVTGFAYSGFVRSLSGVELGREVFVLGYNHNIQSSFGVTKQVITAIRTWISEAAASVLA